MAAAAGDGDVKATTAENAPLMMRSAAPFASVAVASDVFFAGSKGTNAASFGRFCAGFFEAAERIAASTESCPPSELARAANSRRCASSNPGKGRTLVTESGQDSVD